MPSRRSLYRKKAHVILTLLPPLRVYAFPSIGRGYLYSNAAFSYTLQPVTLSPEIPCLSSVFQRHPHHRFLFLTCLYKCVVLYMVQKPGTEVIKSQLSMKLILPLNLKLLTTVNSLLLNLAEHEIFLLINKNANYSRHFHNYLQRKFHAQLS